MIESYELKSSLGICLQTADLPKFSSLLQGCKIKLTELKDSKNWNIFHDIADCRNKETDLEFVQVLVAEFEKQFGADFGIYLEKMLNMIGGKEKMTPLSVSVKNNKKVKNIQELLKSFIKLGANPFFQPETRQNLIFYAAKYGHEFILAYLIKEIGLNCLDTDDLNNTPLHIAIMEKRTIIGLMLIAWSPDLNKQDNKGNTALHLSVTTNNYKITRNLLIRGAKPNIKNLEGLSCKDLATINKNPDILSLFVRHIQNSSFLQKIYPFYTDIKKTKNSYSKHVLFVIIYCLRFFLIIDFLPRVLNFFSFASAGFSISSGILFSITSCKNPGFVIETLEKNILGLLEVYRSEFICFYCEKRKNKNTRHCHICKKCVIV